LVTDLVDKGYDPLALRYLILTSHYRQGLDFTWPGLKSAAQALANLRGIVRQLRKTSRERSQLTDLSSKKIEKYRQKFEKALSDDLGAPQALAVVWEMVKSNIPSYDKLDLLLDFDAVLGLKLAEVKEIKVPSQVKKLAEERFKLRIQGKWDEADQIRKKIEKKGFVIEDTQKGFYLVAEKRGDRPIIVGQLLVTYEWSDWRNQNIWWIQSVYVQKKFRNQKIFSKLYNHVVDIARNKKNICGIRLYVKEQNESAKQVYETLGMTKTSYEIYEKGL